MPTLPEILQQLQFITQETALLGLFLTGGLILVGRAQYILVGLILSRLVRPDIAVLKVMIGAFVCPILFLSARQVTVTPSLIALLSKERRQMAPPTGFVFRLFTVLLMILVAITLSHTFTLTGLSLNITLGVYWLILAGLTTLILTDNPIKVGVGLLTILSGFDLFYTTLERSLLITGLWGTVNLLVALAVSYLVVVRGAGVEEDK